MKRQTGITPEELIGPDFPYLMDNVWSAFKRLNKRREPAAAGIAPINYGQIASFKELTETPISSKQILVIELLDDKYMSIMNE